jgi:hypothetical protein
VLQTGIASPLHMTIAQHKTLSLALGSLSLVRLAALLVTLGRANRYRVDVRYPHDIVGGFDTKRDLAMKGGLSENGSNHNVSTRIVK